MLVNIINIMEDEANTTIRVEFIYTFTHDDIKINGISNFDDYIKLVASWNGNIPEIGRWYDIEIGIDGKLVWGKDVIKIEGERNLIDNDHMGMTTLYGLLEVFDEDYIVLTVGRSIVGLKVINSPVPYKGFVQVHASEITLYDTNTVRI